MSSDYDYILWLQSIQTILYKFGGPTMMGIGTIGCVLSLMVFMKKELRKNPCSMYLIAFNISNLALIYTSMLFTTLANGFGIDPSVYNLSFCHFRFYCMLLFDILSPCYLILASIDRILITSPNALTRQKSTPRLVFISISTVTVFWSLIHVAALILPNFIGLPSGYVICYFQPELYLQIMVYYSAGIKGILIPLLMIILGLWSIKNVRHIRQVAPVFTTHNEETIDRRAVRRSTSKDRQLLQILLIDISVYVIFNIMFSVVFIYQQIAKEEAATLVGSVFQNFLLNTGIFSTYIPYCISCYTNFLVSKTFRHEIKNVLVC